MSSPQKSSENQSKAKQNDELEDSRPIPSQAEGDRETVEEDLKEKTGSSESE
jgi:hypothetical protein